MEAETLKALNIDIINKSQLHKFTSVTNVKGPTFEAKYLDYVKLPSENGIPVLGLQVFSKFISISTYRASASVTREQIEEVKNQTGADVMAMVNNVLVSESAQAMFKLFKRYIAELSTQTYLESYTKWDKFKVWLYKIFKKNYQKAIKINSGRELMYAIIGASNKVMRNGRRGPATFVICNCQTATILSDQPAFIYAPVDQHKLGFTINDNGSIYPLGTMAGLTVYVDPYMTWADNTVYIGRTISQDEPGVQAFVYDDGTKMENIIMDETLAPKVILTTRIAIVPVGFNPQHQYTKLVYKSTKNLL